MDDWIHFPDHRRTLSDAECEKTCERICIIDLIRTGFLYQYSHWYSRQ